MLKIGVLLFQNMTHAPFIKTYEHILESDSDIKYSVLYLNREQELHEPQNEKYVAVRCLGNPVKLVSKILSSINYYFKAKTFIKKNKFDFIIVLTTFPAALLSGFLKKHYKNKYIVDIRDYTQEHFKFYFEKEKEAVENSALNIISSEGYKNFLPESEYLLFHNYNVKSNEQHEFKKAKDRKIIISNIGSISYAEQWKNLVELVNADERFILNLHGNDVTGGVVTEYVKGKNNPRISLLGAFQPEEKESLYIKSDIVFNCYGNKKALVKYAISNRFYEGAYYKKPLIVSPNTVMEEESRGFAYTLDLDNIENLDGLYEWYINLNKEEYEAYAEDVINRSIEENKTTLERIKQAINN